MSDGNLPKKDETIISETGRVSRGGLKSLAELYAPGVDLVSGDLLQPTFKSKITIAVDGFTFNSACVKHFEKTQHIELIMDKPEQRLIAVPSNSIIKESVKFAISKDNINKPRKTTARKFCVLLYKFMEWDIESRYRIMAIYQELEGQELLVFNLDEAVEVQTTTIINDDGKKKTTRDILLPVKFRENFGYGLDETKTRKKVDLDDMFLFIDPKTGETQTRQIEPRVPEAEAIIKSNYRPDPEEKSISVAKEDGETE